jgi:cytochrome P450
LSQIAGFIMVDPPVGSDRWNDARDSMVRLTNALTQKIGTPPNPTQPSNDLLTRLVIKLNGGNRNPSWFDDEWIRRYITGLTVFGGATVVRAATQAIDQLIKHPAGLRHARELTRQLESNSGQDVEAIRAQLLQIIYEALRFRPMLALLDRYVPREAMIAKGSARARMPPAGCVMVTPPVAAMYDPEEFPSPWAFRSGRCLKSYVHFGYGPRLCFGKYIADTLFVEIVCGLLLIGDVERARGSRGRLKYDGPACKSMVLTFNP